MLLSVVWTLGVVLFVVFVLCMAVWCMSLRMQATVTQIQCSMPWFEWFSFQQCVAEVKDEFFVKCALQAMIHQGAVIAERDLSDPANLPVVDEVMSMVPHDDLDCLTFDTMQYHKFKMVKNSGRKKPRFASLKQWVPALNPEPIPSSST